jgi:hypothetical protein
MPLIQAHGGTPKQPVLPLIRVSAPVAASRV